MAVLTKPGSIVTLRTTPSTPSIPTDTGVWFVAGLTDRGPLTPKLVNNLNEFVQIFGDRVTYSPLYDALDLYFREGGNRAYVSRVVGPAAAPGTLTLNDAGAAAALTVTGIGPGAWSSQYKVQVLAGVAAGTFVIRVLDINNVVLEDSGDLLDNTAAVQWGSYSNYIRIAAAGSANDPAVLAATPLSAGTDDRASITDTQWLAAHDRFSKDYGPGQVSSPGRTTDTAHAQIISHAQPFGRVAILDYPDTAVSATIIASAAAARSNFVAGFAPWVVIPGVIAGAPRVVPPSALIAGIIARNDPAYGTNHPGAGRFGRSLISYDLSQADWDDPTRTALNAGGVNVIRRYRGTITIYGWRTTTTDTNWLDFGNSRLFMDMSARLDALSENYLFDEIDGQNGATITDFHGGIVAIMLELYQTKQLFGSTPDEAFSVDTGPGVNTLQTIAANELHAVVSVRMAPMAEFVQIEVVKHAVTEAV